MENNLKLKLAHKALNLRIDSVRATTSSGSGHPTSCLSAADIISALFFHTMKFDPQNPNDKNNDRFILSKGHAIPVVYSAWKQLGVISDDELMNLRKIDSPLEGHPTPRFIYNEAATGSLGQGLAIGIGMAINAKKENLNYKTYVMMGDGEIAEGAIWEAAEIGAHYKLNNLIGIVDCNRLGQSGESIHNHDVEKYAKQFEAFGWKTFVIDGHNIEKIVETLETSNTITNQPVMIIAKTFKGHGLSVANKNGCHGVPFKKDVLEDVISELTLRDASFGSSSGRTGKEITPVKTTATKEVPEKITLDIKSDTNTNLFEKDQKIATRKAFGYAIASLGKKSKNVFALDGDVQNSTHTNIFAKEIPEQFVQCFIAEQTMVGVATGLESRGKIPFAATFGAFLTRAHDQIRMAGIGKNALRLCGSHCGVSIGQDGPSQMGLEDIAMMRAIPNSIVLYPSDGVSTYKLTELMANYNDGISYIRTTRAATPNLYGKDENFEIGKCKILKQSDNDTACIIAAGITVHESLKAYEVLQKQNISVSLIDLFSVKPLDVKTIIDVAKKSGNKIIVVEDHYTEGGISEAVALAVVNENIQVKSIAVTKLSRSGKPEELLKDAGIDADSIVAAVKK